MSCTWFQAEKDGVHHSISKTIREIQLWVFLVFCFVLFGLVFLSEKEVKYKQNDLYLLIRLLAA